MRNLNCPACIAQRLHTAEETKEYHPLSGHGKSMGYGSTEGGWSHPDLEKKTMTYYTTAQTSLEIERAIIQIIKESPLGNHVKQTPKELEPRIAEGYSKYKLTIEVEQIP